VLEDGDGDDIIYNYDAVARILTRTENSLVITNLTECDRLTFDIAQRNTRSNSFEVYPVATTPDTIKVVNVAWLCSRSLFGNKENTESVQTARIVIRKQGS
jgi:acetone carboxylase gamma subunit